jgi:hypothetical protein
MNKCRSLCVRFEYVQNMYGCRVYMLCDELELGSQRRFEKKTKSNISMMHINSFVSSRFSSLSFGLS